MLVMDVGRSKAKTAGTAAEKESIPRSSGFIACRGDEMHIVEKQLFPPHTWTLIIRRMCKSNLANYKAKAPETLDEMCAKLRADYISQGYTIVDLSHLENMND